MTDPRPLPPWADELRRRYLRGEATQFVVHGNVHDLVLTGDQLVTVGEFLSRGLLAPAKETVVAYNVSAGVRFEKKKGEVPALDELLLQRSPDKVLPALERLLHGARQVAVLLEYAEVIAPAAETSFSSEGDRQSVVTLHRWAMSPIIERSDNVVVLLAENLSELHPRLATNPRAPTLRVPMPDLATRRELIEHVAPGLDAAWVDRLAEVTGGLKAVQIKAILEPAPEPEEDQAERERFISGLLAGTPDAAERARKLAALTAGMGRDEVRRLVAPGAPLPAAAADAGREEVLALVHARKREIIERECVGLVEFVGPGPGFEAVGGMEEVKKELAAVAQAMREGRRERCPMGMLFTGPMGTGKTFVAEAFCRESGLTALKLKNFRSKWVGATEANLEKILAVIRAIGQVIVIIDEGDRALGGTDGEGDGGTSSRVIARLKEFMTEGENRGRVLFLLMTNRPDKLDVDIKRAGRLDRKIPFFYPQTAEEVEAILAAQVKRHRLAWTVEFPRDREAASAPLAGYSNADLEAVVLMAGGYAGAGPVTPAHLADAVRDYLPSRDAEMLEYMELIAVFEASSRKLLPAKYAALSAAELQARLAPLRARVGGRR
jgi:SpoVK/Ycf46/Vps4 family AAA+-type ATPase